jgi:ABC-type Fe3+ transport system permease subunit/streptogramin lyase
MNWTLLWNSLIVAILTTVFSLGIGMVCALWLAGLPGRLHSFFLGAAILSLALPPFLVTNCWLHFLGHTGVWHSWLPLNIFSLGGAVWILSMLLWPVSLLFTWGAWQRLEPAQLESDMMVTGWALLRALLFPMARGALAQATVITFVLSLNNFAVPAILQVKVFPAEMWVRFNTSFDTWGTLQMSWPLVLCPLFLLVWLSKREVPWPHQHLPVSGTLLRQQLGRGWFWSSGAFALFVLFCSVCLPAFQILSLPRTWTELPGALAAGRSAVLNSVWYAAAATTTVVGVGLWGVSSAEIRRPKSEGRKKPEARNPKSGIAAPERSALRTLLFGLRISTFFRPSDFGLRAFIAAAWTVFLLPGVLLGIGLIHAFNHTVTTLLYQSGGIVILAFALRYLAIGWHGISRAGQKVDKDLVDVARLEGATHWQVLRHVLWPQIARPVMVTSYVVFVLCLWDVESMILVVPPGGETLALRIFNLLHYGHNAQVNALCFVLLVVALIPLIAATLLSLLGCAGRAGSPLPAAARNSIRLTAVFFGFLVLLTSCTPSANDVTLTSQFFSGVQIIGTRGVGVGQLNKPRSVAVDAADNLYVVDMTGRVQKFSTNGTFLLSWQMPQTELGKPKGMCRDREGNILVVEPHYSRVNVFSPLGKLIAQWGSHGTNDGQLSLPRAVAVNSQGKIFVSEYQEAERVQTFMFDPNRPIVGAELDGSTPRQAPRWISGFGQAGTEPGSFNRPEGLCVDTHDQLYVTDSCNHRIQIFSSDGKFLRSYGKPGSGLGELSYPYDICVDTAGRQYVCEFGNSRIQVFDERNQPVEIIGGPGAEPGRFSNPWGVALDSAGNLYVADSQNHRVQKLLRRR